jgi:hypothetical protein
LPATFWPRPIWGEGRHGHGHGHGASPAASERASPGQSHSLFNVYVHGRALGALALMKHAWPAICDYIHRQLFQSIDARSPGCPYSQLKPQCLWLPTAFSASILWSLSCHTLNLPRCDATPTCCLTTGRCRPTSHSGCCVACAEGGGDRQQSSPATARSIRH